MNKKIFLIIYLILSFGLVFGELKEVETDEVKLSALGGDKNLIYQYDLNNENIVLKAKAKGFDFNSDYKNSYKWYEDSFSDQSSNWLSEEKCVLSKTLNNNLKVNFQIDGYNKGLESYKNIEKNLVNFLKTNNRNDILKNNLWMKTELTYRTYKDTIYIADTGFTKEEIIKLAQAKGLFGKTISFTATPIDNKCDFDNSNKVDNNEIQAKPFSLKIPYKNIKTKKTFDKGISKDFLNDKENLDKKIGVSEGGNLFIKGDKIVVGEINKNISVVVNGIVKNEPQDIKEIALVVHKLKQLDNSTNAKKVLVDIKNNMNRGISKNVSFSSGKTRVKFEVNLSDNEIFWVYFSKEMLPDFSKLKFNKSNVVVRDKDPLVGWKRDVDFEIEGEVNDTGLPVITNEPVVFNSNNLVFNYRKSGCDTFETFLVGVSNVSGGGLSGVEKSAGFGFDEYNLCVSHLDISNVEVKPFDIVLNLHHKCNIR